MCVSSTASIPNTRSSRSWWRFVGNDGTATNNNKQGVGYPHQFANYRKGDTVIDLGCGMGVDTRIAARRVGTTGHAYGIDLRCCVLYTAKLCEI